jgi:NhaP-type Na+/H+ or K+/H+ antiporter
MSENPLVGIATIFALGIGAQWVAWRLRLPAILLLLIAGMAAGPGTAWMAQQGWMHGPVLDPNRLLGRLLLPMVSLSVGIILFEGSLTLTLNQIAGAGHVVGKLVTIGAGVTWICAAMAAHFVLAMPGPLAILLGAILVVTGPTVIGPLLRHVRPVGQVGPILRWEGIVIDPIGVLLTVLVFQVISAGPRPWAVFAQEVMTTVAVGVGLGMAGAVVLVVLLRRYWVPDYLQNPVALMTVAVSFAASNAIQHESGLFATTVMGMVLANQRYVSIHHIQEFKENLSVLLISSLFIVLGARLDVGQIAQVRWSHVLFIASLILVVRPLAVLASTVGPGITWRERAFLAWMAPRGVVAASVASVFAIELGDAGFPGAGQVVPAIFAVIVGTVTVYGLTASWVARRLGLAKPVATGVLIVGANRLARVIGKALHDDGFEVLLVDTSQENVRTARMEGLPVYFGSVNSEQVLERIQLSGVGRLLALTPNDTVNGLAATRYARVFGRAEAYTLPPHVGHGGRGELVPHEHRGRPLFGRGVTFDDLERRVEAGAVVKRTKLTDQFGYEKFREANSEAVPLFLVEPGGVLGVITADGPAAARAGQTLISLAPAATADRSATDA